MRCMSLDYWSRKASAKCFHLRFHEQLLPLEQAINARWGDRVNVSFSTLTCLEVMAGGVSKGHAGSSGEETGLQPEGLYCVW